MAVLSQLTAQRDALKSYAPAPTTARGQRMVGLVALAGFVSALGAGLVYIALGLSLDTLIDSDPPAGTHLGLLVAGLAVHGLGQGGRTFMGARAAARSEAELRARVLATFLSRGPARAAAHRSGAFISLLIDGAERVALYRQTFLPDALMLAALPAGLLVLLGVVVDPVSALVLAACVVVIPVLVVGFERLFSRSSSSSRSERARLSASYLDAIQGLETLAVMGATRRVGRRLAQVGEANRRAIMRLLAGNQVVLFVIDIAFSLALLLVATALAISRTLSGVLSPGQAVVIVGFALLLLEPMDLVGAFFYVAMGGLASERAIRRFLGTGQDVDGAALRPAAAVSATVDGTVDDDVADLAGAEGRSAEAASSAGSAPLVEARDLTFSYGTTRAVCGVDLSVQTGESVAIVGASGGGKSTLLSLLTGDLTPESGTLRVAGVSRPEEIRQHTAVVAQSTWLFTDTIAGNLRLARPDATEDEMWEALAIARLDADVATMPAGLETVIGDQGIGLSGGQAQRLSLARAVLSGRDLLLLDEPTSQVDLVSEQEIIEALASIARERTIVMVTHRKTSLLATDRVLTMNDGHLAETPPARPAEPNTGDHP